MREILRNPRVLIDTVGGAGDVTVFGTGEGDEAQSISGPDSGRQTNSRIGTVHLFLHLYGAARLPFGNGGVHSVNDISAGPKLTDSFNSIRHGKAKIL
jgi:hypothetical protein